MKAGQRKESGEVETFGVDWSNPHEMAADSAKSSGPGRNRVDPRIINMTDSSRAIATAIPKFSQQILIRTVSS